MKILVVNCGSSSLKYQLIDMEDEHVMAKGNFERIGDKEAFLTHKVKDQSYVIEEPVKNHTEALKIILSQLTDTDYKVINSLKEIEAIGHRIVHGGEFFDRSAVVTEEVIDKIDKCVPLAPLHNPAAILGIRACQEAMPGVPMVTVFDTAFHQTLPPKAYVYQLPYEYYEKHRIRKYGAHGTSHRYIAERIAEIKNNEHLKIISCHLGQGASLCAIKDGISLDTSMGLTPLAGIPMGTRSGDVDPSIIPTVMKLYNLTPDEMQHILNKESGALGVSGVSSDSRDVEKAASEGNERAKLALDARSYITAQYIAKFIVTLGGVDAIAFAGGIGENSKEERERICEYLECFGVKIDKEQNNVRGVERKISTDDSKVDVFIIPTNEEIKIARDTKRLVSE